MKRKLKFEGLASGETSPSRSGGEAEAGGGGGQQHRQRKQMVASGAPKKKKRKISLSEEMTTYKLYAKKVEKYVPVHPRDDVVKMVTKATPGNVREMLKTFGLEDYEKMIPKESLVDLTAGIIIEKINGPVRSLVERFLPHFFKLKEFVEEECKDDDAPSIVDRLKAMKPPGEGEAEFCDFVDAANGILRHVIQRVATAIEDRELIKGAGTAAGAILNKVQIDRNIKHGICIYFTNYICTFSGTALYRFFMNDRDFIERVVMEHIP